MDIDAVLNAYAFDTISQPYVDVWKLGDKLKGVVDFNQHEYKARVSF